MRDYITIAKEISHNMPMNSQAMLKSFKAALEKITAEGVTFEKIITIDCWEFKIGAPKQQGLLPVIYHANFRPTGF